MSTLTVQTINSVLTQGYWLSTRLFRQPQGLQDLRSFVKEHQALGNNELTEAQVRQLISVFRQRNDRMKDQRRYYQFKDNRTDQVFLKLMPMLYAAAKAKGMEHECKPLFVRLPNTGHVPPEHMHAFSELYDAKVSTVVVESRAYAMVGEDAAKLCVAVRHYGRKAINLLSEEERYKVYFLAAHQRNMEVTGKVSTYIQYARMRDLDRRELFCLFKTRSIDRAQAPSDFFENCILRLESNFFDIPENQDWLLEHPDLISEVLSYHRDNDRRLPQWLAENLFVDPTLARRLSEHPVSKSVVALRALAEIEHALVTDKKLYIGPHSVDILSKGYALMGGELAVASRVHTLLVEHFSGYPDFLKKQIKDFIGPMSRAIWTSEVSAQMREKWQVLLRIMRESMHSRRVTLGHLQALLPTGTELTQHSPVRFSRSQRQYERIYGASPHYRFFPRRHYAKLMGRYHVSLDTFCRLGELHTSFRAAGCIETVLRHRHLTDLHVKTLNKLARLADRDRLTGSALTIHLLEAIDKTFSHLNPDHILYRARLKQAYDDLPSRASYRGQYQRLQRDSLIVVMPRLNLTSAQLTFLLQLSDHYYSIDEIIAMQADRDFIWDSGGVEILNWAMCKEQYREEGESYSNFVARCQALKIAEARMVVPVPPPPVEPSHLTLYQLRMIYNLFQAAATTQNLATQVTALIASFGAAVTIQAVAAQANLVAESLSSRTGAYSFLTQGKARAERFEVLAENLLALEV